MNIIIEKAGKKFNKDWIFRHFSFSFQQGNSYAITGPNGSGKSTLLQVISGSMNVTQGSVQYVMNDKPVATDDVYRHVAIVAPYLEVIEEMTAVEFLQFHAVFKKLILPVDEILSIVQLGHTKGKQIRNFSSGMKQRVKLAQAIFSDVPVVLLDEPCTNLDKAGYELYHSLINNYCDGKMVIVSSNDVNEYSFCDTIIDVMAYKNATSRTYGVS